MSHLIRHSVYNFATLSTTQQIFTIRDLFSASPHLSKYPSRQEKQLVAQQLGMDLEELNGVIMRAREEERHGSGQNEGFTTVAVENLPGHDDTTQSITNHQLSTINPTRAIPTQQRLILKEWVTTHKSHSRPTPIQLKRLMNQTNLSKKQILGTLRTLAQHRGHLSSESKKIVLKWLEDNHFRKPTPLERDALLKETKWNREQLKQQIEIMRDPPGELTEESKQIVSAWLEENDYRMPTKLERDSLREYTQWSRKQLTFQIESLRMAKRRITDGDRQIVLEWLTSNGNRNPTPEERHVLMRETNLTPRQLAKAIWYLRDPPGQLTDEAKEYVQEWLLKHGMRNPSIEEKRDIQRHTGLNLEQIRAQIRALTQKRPGKITPEAKEKIREWLEQGGQLSDGLAELPKTMDDLCSETGLNRRQVHSQIAMLRKEWKMSRSNDGMDEISRAID